jgi:ribonuclease HI
LAQERVIVSLGLHTTVFQTEYYAIKACITENMEKGYTGRNIYSLPDSQAAIKAIDIILINSKLVWDCHQSVVKVSERNRNQLVWMPGHMGIDGNEITDKLVRKGSSHPLIGHKPVLCISAEDTGGVIGDWMSRIHEEHWQCVHGQRQAKDILKRPCAKKAGELLKLNRNQLKIISGLLI